MQLQQQQQPQQQGEGDGKAAAGTLAIDEAVERIGFGRFQITLVIICGCIQAADSMEMILLSFLGHSVQCQWHLMSQHVALITTCVFVGTIFGSPLLGACSDRYGRWNTLLLSAVMIAYYGALSSASPNIMWICFLRAMVGFAIGGLLPLTSTMTGEFMPTRYRAPFIICMMGFWTLGALLEVLIAWMTLGTEFVENSWRKTMALTAVPLFLLLPLFAWMPRSPRYLLAAGRNEEAVQQLNRAAVANGKQPLQQQLQADKVHNRGSIRSLIANTTMIRLTALLILLWFAFGLLYYGLILITTELPLVPHRCLQNFSQFSNVTKQSHGNCCRSLSNADYATAAVATLGEFVGYLLLLLLIDTCGRRPVLVLFPLLLCVMLIALQLCMSHELLAAVLFFARSFAIAQFNAAYIYSNEAFPTSVRTLGMGVCCASSRIGALLSPFIAQVLLPETSTFAALCIYAAVAVAASIAALLLPFDTKGRDLKQTVQETHADVQPFLFHREPHSDGYGSLDLHKNK